MMVPHADEQEFLLSDEDKVKTPEVARFLRAALQHPFYDGDIDKEL